MTAPPSRFVVVKVHNNNVVQAVDASGRPVVLAGGGVGYGARRGTLVDADRIESVYVPRDDADRAGQTLAQIPPEVVGTARAIVEHAESTLGLPRSDVLLLPIADHLYQALRREREGIVVDIPLVWEVALLYPDELRVGRDALDIVAARLGVRLPASEATAFALHLVSTHFSRAGIDRTVLLTQSLSDTFDLIDAHRGTPIDRTGQAAARFVAHLRYLFVRLIEGRAVPPAPEHLCAAVATSLPDEMPVARSVADLLHRTWGTPLNDDETAYIALHIHRLLRETQQP